MTLAIIQFPGSNCETETLRAVRNVGMQAEEFLWNRNQNDLTKFDGYIIVGGFSYEDRSRSGIIAALDPLIPYLRAEAEKGKPVLGICNGAQILVETGMVPGLKKYAVGMALAENKRVKNGQVLGTGYYNAWVQMKLTVDPLRTAFTRKLKAGAILDVPIAHGEGRFIIPSELLNEMKRNGQTIFCYSDAMGNTTEEFPTNPNGAIYNLAAVSNTAGNVMAMMPHPERRPDMGRAIFESLRDYIREPAALSAYASLSFAPPPLVTPNYALPTSACSIMTVLIITDNEAKTVEATLRQLGLAVIVERITYWEIENEAQHTTELKQILVSSGELFNPNKERLVQNPPTHERLSEGEGVTLLVRPRENFVGQQKKQSLEQRFGLTTITRINKGSLWKIRPAHGTIPNLLSRILETNILYNQFSQECFVYKG